MEAARDLERLPLRPVGCRVRGQVASGRDEWQRGVSCAGEQLVLANGGLDALDRVEVAVLPHERGAQNGDEAA